MWGKGICFDTGFFNKGGSTREPFDSDVVRREMQIIHDDLHCTAVRITGGSLERLKTAATQAAAAGLEVWICPFTTELTTEEMFAFLVECAEHGEKLRQQGAEVVLVTGSELSLFNKGFLPGETFLERCALVTQPNPRLRELIAEVPPRLNDFLDQAVAKIRAMFGGKVSYASLPFERIDWTPFDFLATDAGYRTQAMADRYRDLMRAFVAQGKALGKPVAITEFGCGTFRGSAELGGRGWEGMIEWDDATTTPLRLKGDYVRDEAQQAAYLRELLEIFDVEGIDTAFAHNFACYFLPHRSDPRDDLDMVGSGVVKILEGRFGNTYPDMRWEPKAAFATLADVYRS